MMIRWNSGCQQLPRHGAAGPNTFFSGDVFIDKHVTIGGFCLIGYSEDHSFDSYRLLDRDEPSATAICRDVVIHPFTVICRGAKIGPRVIIDAHARIGEKTKVGAESRIVYGGQLHYSVTIGKKSIISGFCCDGSKIGDGTTMMGNLVHNVKKPISRSDWDEGPQPRSAPVIGNRVLVGYGATIIGGVRIEDDATVGAGAVVTRSVPKGKTVKGVPARIVGQSEASLRGRR